jgi:hypothetical protein
LNPAGLRTNQVSVLEVEAIELIACLLGVVYVLVDHECGTLRVVGDTLANLPINEEKLTVSGGPTSEMGGSAEGFYRMGPNLPKRSNS